MRILEAEIERKQDRWELEIAKDYVKIRCGVHEAGKGISEKVKRTGTLLILAN